MIYLFVLLLALGVAFLTVVLINQNRKRGGPRASRSTPKKSKP